MIVEPFGLEDLAQRINAEHEECRTAARTSLEHAIKAGQLLIEAKALVQHGDWLPWLEAHCTVKESTARLYMQLARDLPQVLERDKSLTVSDLGIREARALLLAEREPTAAPAPTPAASLWDRVTGGQVAPVALTEENANSEPDSTDEEGEEDGLLENDPHQWVARAQQNGMEEEYIVEELADHVAMLRRERDDARRTDPPRLPAPLTPAIAAEQTAEEDLAERWKKDDDVHRALWHMARITMLDPHEAAHLLGGVAALRTFAQNDKAIADRASEWLRAYSRALEESLGVEPTGLRRVQ